MIQHYVLFMVSNLYCFYKYICILMEKYILTGGPGTGKTTMIQEFKRRGHHTFPEVARQIIAEEQAKEKGILPWTDLALFQELVVKRQAAQEKNVSTSKKIFLDRALPYNLSYAESGNVAGPPAK